MIIKVCSRCKLEKEHYKQNSNPCIDCLKSPELVEQRRLARIRRKQDPEYRQKLRDKINKWRKENKYGLYAGQIKRRQENRVVKCRKLKEKYCNLLGGKCSICGYNKCNAALDFHHKDPKEKDINISILISESIDTDILRKEVLKCILVCKNCHAEIHYKDKKKG